MALSQITYTGDGNTTQYVLNFAMGYLDRDNINCRVNNEVDSNGQPRYRELTWINSNTVQIQGVVPAFGVPIVFARTVPKTSLIIDFENGAIQNEENLDDAQRHAFMAIHEILDGRVPIFVDIMAQLQYLSAAIAAETISRQEADALLSDRLDLETAARMAADLDILIQLNGESQARLDADNAIYARIDLIEGNVQQYVFDAQQYALMSQQYSEDAHLLLEQILASGTGWRDNTAYDFGFITEVLTYFDQDWGLITDPIENVAPPETGTDAGEY